MHMSPGISTSIPEVNGNARSAGDSQGGVTVRPVEVNIPAESIAAGWHEFRYPRPAVDEPSEAFKRGLRAAAPLIAAADYEQFAAELRATLHNLPEYTHGSLAWTLMNAIDAHIEDLRGESR
jgi:hypothetical protein